MWHLCTLHGGGVVFCPCSSDTEANVTKNRKIKKKLKIEKKNRKIGKNLNVLFGSLFFPEFQIERSHLILFFPRVPLFLS